MRPELFPIVGTHPLDAEQLYRLGLDLERLARERDSRQEFPAVYPEEPRAVHGFWEEVRSLYEKGQKTKEYVALLSRMAYAYKEKGGEGVRGFIYENLDGLVSNITSGEVKDFDTYRDFEYGDSALALLGRYIATLELTEKALPKLEREVFYPGGEESERAFDRGAILFVCGYGATFEPYTRIFNHFNLPVVAYQLPHGVISENPDSVGETFNNVYGEILKDPLLGKVTHVIGNSIGTMFASRLAVDLGSEDPERNIKVALVQVGMGWQGALEKTHAKFGRQLRERVAKRGLTLEDFSEATQKYNPGALVDDLSELVSRGQLDLSLFIGLGDKVISPASEEIEPLLKKLDSGKASGKYNAYTSEVAGHNSAVLFFLWLAFQKVTEWSRVFKCFNPETDLIETPTELLHYHIRRTKWER